MARRATLILTFFFMSMNLANAASNIQTCWLDEGSCRAFVGKRLWVAIPPGNPNVVEVTFTQHNWDNTLKLKSGASFVVKDLAKGSVGSDDYLVMLDDGRRGWTGTAGMSRAVLKFARQASLSEQATRPWLAVQDWG